LDLAAALEVVVESEVPVVSVWAEVSEVLEVLVEELVELGYHNRLSFDKP